jgi:plastocyanin
MMRRFVLGLVAAGFLVAVIAVTACSDDDDNNGSGAAAATATSAPAAATATIAPPAAPTAIPAAPNTGGAVAMNIVDLGYSPSTLTGRVGQPVSLAVRNTGNLPHSFTIDGVVESGTLQGGGQTTIQFTPGQAGALTFYCTIHGVAGMSGTMTVSP